MDNNIVTVLCRLIALFVILQGRLIALLNQGNLNLIAKDGNNKMKCSEKYIHLEEMSTLRF